MNFKKKIYLFIVIFHSLTLTVWGQNDTLKLINNSKPRIVFQIDVRNTFIQDNSNYKKLVYGFWVGLDYSKKHIYTLGLYTTNNPFEPLSVKYLLGTSNQVIKQYYNFEMYFASLGYQYIFFNKYHVQMSCPIEAGFGLGRAYVERHWFDNGNPMEYDVTLFSKFVPVQLGYAIEWKATPWFGLNSQIGYRKSLFTNLLNDNQNINYDGLYYTYGFRLYFGRIIKDSKNLLKSKKRN